MNVQLYVYDLSKGLAAEISFALLGVQINAVYHTSIVMGNIEYVYDGGVKTVAPGKTHLGPPKQIIELGTTNLPMDVIMEYLDSLKQVYTPEAYDLWSHNCNNFSHDFATFLIGKGIPDHITNLPETVLSSPFGKVLKPHIDQMVARQQRKNGAGTLLGIESNRQKPKTQQERASSVRIATTMVQLEKLLQEAEKSCAVIFFTSQTCAPCKKLYPIYEELAAEVAHRAILILVDVDRSFDIATKHSISATPTFKTFLHGTEENKWSGADGNNLRANIGMLVKMAFPPHPHELLRLPALLNTNTQPVLFGKIPPLSKLKAKMGSAGEESAVTSVMHFVSARASDGAAEAALPDLDAFSIFLQNGLSKLPAEIMFTIVDLMRVALFDPRFSGYYAEEKDHRTVARLISYVNDLGTDCPYSLRLVALQMACNLFTSPLYPIHILKCPTLTEPIVQLIATSLLDDKHHNARVAAASLSFNIATSNSKLRAEEHLESLPEEQQVELAASILEAISLEEDSPEALKGLLLAFGYLVYRAPKNGEVVDLLKSMDAQGTVLAKQEMFPREALVKEIGDVLLGKGLE